MTLQDYEARIWLYREQIGTGYIGIGRTLNEAKEAKVVPHGQWESWVEQTTGLTIRQAQRCMQAATEIRDGSALARLEMSKALLLLSSGLEEETREAIAEKAAEEGATVKALREEVRQAKLKLVQETGVATEIRQELRKAEEREKQLVQQMKALHDGMQERLDQECGLAYKRGADDTRTETEREIRKQFQGKIDYINSERAELDECRKQLLRQLKEAESANSSRWDDGYRAGVAYGEQQQAQLKRNEQDLLEAAEDAERRAAEAEAALNALREGQEAGRQETAPAAILGKAVATFFGECELMPYYPETLRRDGQALRDLVARLEDWCCRMRTAMDGCGIDAEAVIE